MPELNCTMALDKGQNIFHTSYFFISANTIRRKLAKFEFVIIFISLRAMPIT